MKVVFLTKYSYKGASSRYRFYKYSDYFDKFEYEFIPLLDDSYINELYKTKSNKFLLTYYIIKSIFQRIYYLINASRRNLYVIEKELIPNMPYFFESLLLSNKRYCLDYDDYVGTSYSSSPLKKIFLKNKLQNLVEKSKLTTVGNKWYFKAFNQHKSLRYLPTNINFSEYEEVVHNSSNSITKDFTLIWIGSKTTAKYLDIVKKPFLSLAEKYPIYLKVIGGNAPFDHKNIIHTKWSEKSEIQSLLTGDVGIMPLYNSVWEKGKCGFKLIQYMGIGLPVLASPSPANNEIICGNGYICNTETEWHDNIEKLFNDYQLRKQMGEESENRVKQYYSYEVWGTRYSDWLFDLLICG